MFVLEKGVGNALNCTRKGESVALFPGGGGFSL